MLLPLLLSLVVSATDDPPVKVWLNHDNYFQRGDNARVNVRLADDGYLLVLRADADGRVRVLFPLDPSDDNFMRGHETIEVRGRGDREAFYVDDREGSGLVLAARSTTPFKFDEFVRGDHWDYRVLDARQAGDDKEAALLDMLQRMTAEGRFDYDAVTYVVASARAYYDSYYPHYTMVNFGYGWPYRHRYYGYGLYSTCYDPFFYDPFLCSSSIFYQPYGYGYYGYGYGYRRYYGGGYGFYNRPRNLFVNKVRPGTGWTMAFKDQPGTNTSVGGVGPRFRVPEGTLITRRRPDATPVRERDAMQRDGRDRATSFPTRDGGDVRNRGAAGDRGDAGVRGDRGNGGDVRDRGDRPDRSPPTVREPERRGGDRSGGGDRDGGRAAPERRGGGGGGGGGGDRVSAPRSSGGGDRGARAAPSNRGDGGGGGGGNRGNSGGGSRRKP
jgi:hypothetical protein